MGSDWDVPHIVLFVQISTLWRVTEHSKVLVTGTESLVRTTSSGYLDLVSTVGGKVGSATWAGTCRTAIPFIGWAIANWFFPHPEGTWTHSKEHERMIQSTQRKMLRFIIQTKRKYKTKTQGEKGRYNGRGSWETDEEEEEEEKMKTMEL